MKEAPGDSGKSTGDGLSRERVKCPQIPSRGLGRRPIAARPERLLASGCSTVPRK
jgi:hypothetical protein